MFARLFLTDLFIHGIGGAKYDELGDEVVRRFFGIEPAGYLTLSLTLWLDLGTDPATPERLHASERALRDLIYNPERQIADPDRPERAWIEAKRAAIEGPVETHANRVQRFRAIRHANEALQSAVAKARRDVEHERARMLAGLQRNALARSREYALVLHSQGRLRSVLGAHEAEPLPG
jgi:hypothetical protein